MKTLNFEGIKNSEYGIKKKKVSIKFGGQSRCRSRHSFLIFFTTKCCGKSSYWACTGVSHYQSGQHVWLAFSRFLSFLWMFSSLAIILLVACRLQYFIQGWISQTLVFVFPCRTLQIVCIRLWGKRWTWRSQNTLKVSNISVSIRMIKKPTVDRRGVRV